MQIAINEKQILRKEKHEKGKLTKSSIILIFVLLVYSFTLLYMYFWGFLTSLKSNSDFRTNILGLPMGLPWEWEWRNYLEAFRNIKAPITATNGGLRSVFLPEMFLNSFIFSALGPIVSTTVTWLVAYVLSAFPNRFSKFVYRINIVLMMIPIVGALPSALSIYRSLKLYDSWLYVAISSISFVGGNLLIFHAYFQTIAKELKEAASIDGAGNWTVMFKIIFPLTAKMYGILFLMAFISRWNDYMSMVIWLPSKPTIAFGMYRYSTSTETSSSWPPMQMAGCMILMLPILVLFLIFKDKLIGQVTMGALKG